MHHPSPLPTDHDLLTRYLAASDQSAFTDLAARHIDSLYAAATRQVRDPHLAEEVVQTVLLILARRAPTLRNTGSLAGWLHKVLWFTTRAANRTRACRLRHEQKAHAMSPHPPQSADAPALLNELTPLLDDALAKLTDIERSTILLRFMQDRPLAEVAHLLNITEAAATKRISRALANLRRLLARRGADLSASSLSATLIAAKSPPAPAHLLPGATHAALTGTTAPLLTHTLRALALAKLKLTLALTAACSLLILLTAMLTFHIAAPSHAAAPVNTTQPDERLIHLGKILEPSSDQLLAQTLAGIQDCQAKLKTLQIDATYTTTDPDIATGGASPDSETTGTGWIDASTGRFRVEISLQRTPWTNGAAPFLDDSFWTVWDGVKALTLHVPPHSSRRGEIFNRQTLAFGQIVIGRLFSTQLIQRLMMQDNRELNINPLDQKSLAALHLTARRVIMDGHEAMELETRFNIPDGFHGLQRQQLESFSTTYWFDPSRGYALLGYRQAEDGQPPIEERIIDELTEAAPGIFYPTRARIISYARDKTRQWHLYYTGEFHATRVIANQPLDPSLFHLDFPPGIPISHRGPSASSQPTSQP